MKKIKYLVFTTLAALGLTLTSCEDFFDNTSRDAIPPNLAFGDPVAIEQSLKSIYAMFSNNNIYRNRLACGYQGINTDIEFNSKTGAAEMQLNRYNALLSNSAVSTPNPEQDNWAVMVSMVDGLNTALASIAQIRADFAAEYPDEEFDNKDIIHLEGEVLTMRAFVYLEMIKLWGDVPARFTPRDQGADNTPKTDRNVIFRQLREDLKRAATLMDWSENIQYLWAKNNVTRANKAFALGLLARNNLMFAGYALRASDPAVKNGTRALRPDETWAVQLNTDDAALRQELYQEVVDATGEIIAHYGTSKLAGDFAQVFQDVCQDNLAFSRTEWIWTMKFTSRTRGQFMNYNAIKSKDAAGWLHNVAVNFTTGNNVQQIVPTFVFDFDKNDKRKWVTVAPFTWNADDASGTQSDTLVRAEKFPGSSIHGERRLYQKNVDITSIYLGKYRYEWMKREYNFADDGVDYPVMRYADILLMYAEASIGGISGDVPATPFYSGAISPQEAYDAVRARAGLGSKPITMDNLIDERAFEFCGEYIRKADLQRWGILKSQLTKTQKRIDDLDKKQGDFAGVSDNIYFTYKLDNKYLSTSIPENLVPTEGARGYVVDQWIGFDKNDVPPFGAGDDGTNFGKDTPWVQKNPYDDNGVRRLANYQLYTNENTIDTRHYWPIFDINVNGSNGTLWNDLW